MDFTSAKAYILSRLEKELDPRLVYHSYLHTLDVCRASTELARQEDLSEEEKRLLETAALFHDAGMLTSYENHEETSAALAAELLQKFGYDLTQIGIIRELILNTRLPQMATGKLGRILCDADLDYLGREDFFINSFCLKLEWHLFGIKTYALHDWFLLQEEFLQHHHYLSTAAEKLRNTGKLKNLEIIQAYNHSKHNQLT